MSRGASSEFALQCQKQFVRPGVGSAVGKYVQILGRIIPCVLINMMRDLFSNCARNGAMQANGGRAAAISKVSRLKKRAVRSLRFLYRWSTHRSSRWHCGRSAHSQIAVLELHTGRQAIRFPLVRVQRVTVPLQHLVVPGAQVKRRHWPITVFAGATNYFAAPSVLRRTILLDPPVVHEAIPISRMFPSTSFNTAKAVLFRRCHASII